MNSSLLNDVISDRTEKFQDNIRLNMLLSELSGLLKPVQRMVKFNNSSLPVGFIVGNPRSGTTLFLQWLAAMPCFSYPTNFLTRFAYSPYVGALIQNMLFDPDYDYHGDFSDIQSGVNFVSDLGKSKGALATSEFQHFFRNYMPNFDIEYLTDKALSKVDCDGIAAGLASLEMVFAKPFVTKASLLQFNIPYFSERIPLLFWFHVQRKPIFVMQSILKARENYYGNRTCWLSAKPMEYKWLKDLDVYHQIAGQVYYSEKAIKEGMRKVSDKRKLCVDYVSFCKEPERYYKLIVEKYAMMGCELPLEYSGETKFKSANLYSSCDKDIDGLQRAYDDFLKGVF
ncbi:MAG: hypothetical protein PF904_10360 [Kiritimatiellae bacterium]|jgi:hypothetical protein|nr:hypothetical protein [Kiritimatiellia bacterium]